MITIKCARERLGLTQKELADRVGVDQTEISKLEKGKRQLTVRWAVRLSLALFVDPIELIEVVINNELHIVLKESRGTSGEQGGAS